MILCPLQDTAMKLFNWVRVKPYVTQHFGENRQLYKRFGMIGHNGTDLRARVGTQLFAPMDGKVEVRNYGDKGLGRHIRISNARLMIILAHLDHVSVQAGQQVKMGDKIALSGNSGFSTGPHVHISGYVLKNGETQNKDNGFRGAFDLEAHMLRWKGTLKKNTI